MGPVQRHPMDADGFGDAMGGGGSRSLNPVQRQEGPPTDNAEQVAEQQVEPEQDAAPAVDLPAAEEVQSLRDTYGANATFTTFIDAYATGGYPGLRTAIQGAQDQVPALGDQFFSFLSDADYWDFFREEIVRIAQEEYDNWEDEDGGRVQETENPGPEAGWTRVVDYWEDGAGVNWIDTAAEVGSNDNPWSATFISWVLNTAGHFGAFTPSAAHSNFFEDALENRQDRTANPFKVYCLDELKPQVGDLAIRNRAGGTMTINTLDGGTFSHSDIITEIDTEAQTVTLIGGNVSQSVNTSTASLNDDGYMTGGGYFALMRIGEADFETDDNTDALFTIEVVSTTLNVRETPFVLRNNNTGADESNINKVGELAQGDQRQVFEERDGWYRIGDDEWVSAGARFVRRVEAEADGGGDAPNRE